MFLIVKRKLFVFHQWLFSCMFCRYYPVENFFSISVFLRISSTNGCWILSKVFYSTIDIVMWFLFLLVVVMNIFNWLFNVEPWILAYLDKSLFVVVFNFFLAEFSLLKFCWWFLYLCSWRKLVYNFLFLYFISFGIRTLWAS